MESPHPKSQRGGYRADGTNRRTRIASTTGEQCKRGALKGGTLCQKHSSLPRIKAAAARRAAMGEVVVVAQRSGVAVGDLPRLVLGLVAYHGQLLGQLDNLLNEQQAFDTIDGMRAS